MLWQLPQPHHVIGSYHPLCTVVNMVSNVNIDDFNTSIPLEFSRILWNPVEWMHSCRNMWGIKKYSSISEMMKLESQKSLWYMPVTYHSAISALSMLQFAERVSKCDIYQAEAHLTVEHIFLR